MLTPFSPQWYAREQDWIDACGAAYDEAATKLTAEGWQSHPHPVYAKGTRIFTREGEAVILVRKLGQSAWRPAPAAV